MSPLDANNAQTNNVLTLATAASSPRFDAGMSPLPIPGKAEQKWLRGVGRGHQPQAQLAGRPIESCQGRRLAARQYRRVPSDARAGTAGRAVRPSRGGL